MIYLSTLPPPPHSWAERAATTTAKRHSPEHYRQMAARRKTRGGGNTRKPGVVSAFVSSGIFHLLLVFQAVFVDHPKRFQPQFLAFRLSGVLLLESHSGVLLAVLSSLPFSSTPVSEFQTGGIILRVKTKSPARWPRHFRLNLDTSIVAQDGARLSLGGPELAISRGRELQQPAGEF